MPLLALTGAHASYGRTFFLLEKATTIHGVHERSGNRMLNKTERKKRGEKKNTRASLCWPLTRNAHVMCGSGERRSVTPRKHPT